MKCPRCLITGEEHFYKSTILRRGHNSECKKCHAKRSNAHRKKNPEQVKRYAKSYRKKNGEYLRDYARRFNAFVKQSVFDYYGRVCKCCGFSDEAFLSMDHINNDGYKERQGGTALYNTIFKAGFPDTFQTLCFNCNFGKNVNKGICPHKSRKDHARVQDPRKNSMYATKLREKMSDPSFAEKVKGML